jgi:hypothetical protein
MERDQLEAEVDALFERTDARIHKVMSAILEIVRSSMIIDNQSSSYNSNRGTTNEEATTHHDSDH